MHLKRVMLFLLAVALLVSLPVSAQEAQQEAVIAVGSAEAEPTQVITVPITISGNPGFLGFVLDVTYDEAILQLESVQQGELTEGEGYWAANTEESGMAAVCWFDGKEVVGDGELFVLTFAVLEDAPIGSTEVSVAFRENLPESLIDQTGQPISVSFHSGIIDVREYRWNVFEKNTQVTQDSKILTSDIEIIRRDLDRPISVLAVAAGYNASGKQVAIWVQSVQLPSDQPIEVKLCADEAIASAKLYLLDSETNVPLSSEYKFDHSR